MGIFYVLFVIVVITSTSNAVNLTDGLDGLAIGTVIMAALAFSVLSYISGNAKFAEYLFVPYIKGSGELTIFCSSIFGAGLGFLWFNCYPVYFQGRGGLSRLWWGAGDSGAPDKKGVAFGDCRWHIRGRGVIRHSAGGVL
jgi:phospho-N-acetylmuramoyl-pentapeptide-transferase